MIIDLLPCPRREFLQMMLGKENSVLKMILMFEALKQKNLQDSPPPKRHVASLLVRDAPPANQQRN